MVGGRDRVELDMQLPPRGELWDILFLGSFSTILKVEYAKNCIENCIFYPVPHLIFMGQWKIFFVSIQFSQSDTLHQKVTFPHHYKNKIFMG